MTQKTVSYVGTVADMAAVFSFVMAHVDEFEAPHIEVTPKEVLHELLPLDSDWRQVFEVKVSGIVSEAVEEVALVGAEGEDG